MNEEFIFEESDKIEYYLLFYTEKEVIDGGEIKIHLKQEMIPAHLKDKFLSEMEDKIKSNTISKDDICDFLERNMDLG